jgi:hypothetical protein
MISERLAIQLMIAQGVLFAAETATIHHIGSRASVMQLALVRGTGGLVLAVVLARNLGFAVVPKSTIAPELLEHTDIERLVGGRLEAFGPICTRIPGRFDRRLGLTSPWFSLLSSYRSSWCPSLRALPVRTRQQIIVLPPAADER